MISAWPRSRESDDKSLADSPNARSIDYVALERGTGVKKNDIRSDIYFAGCILYNMLTGLAPLLETRDRLMRMSISRFQEIKPIQQVAPDLPVNVVSVVNRAMAFAPDDRYQEPGEMLADLKRTKQVLEQDTARLVAAGEDSAGESQAEAGQAADEDEPGLPVLEGEGRTVMFVESNMDMQNLFRAQLKKRGYRVLILNDPVRAVRRFEEQAGVADCVVFSAQELGSQAVAGFNRLGEVESTRDMPAILLVDQRRRELVQGARTAGHRLLLPLPISLKVLRQKLEALLSVRSEE